MWRSAGASAHRFCATCQRPGVWAPQASPGLDTFVPGRSVLGTAAVKVGAATGGNPAAVRNVETATELVWAADVGAEAAWLLLSAAMRTQVRRSLLAQAGSGLVSELTLRQKESLKRLSLGALPACLACRRGP